MALYGIYSTMSFDLPAQCTAMCDIAYQTTVCSARAYTDLCQLLQISQCGTVPHYHALGRILSTLKYYYRFNYSMYGFSLQLLDEVQRPSLKQEVITFIKTSVSGEDSSALPVVSNDNIVLDTVLDLLPLAAKKRQPEV